MAVLPNPPKTGNSNLDRWCSDLKRALEQELDSVRKAITMQPFYSGTSTVASQLPSAALPYRWIFAIGTATQGPAWNDGTAWRWYGTGARIVR